MCDKPSCGDKCAQLAVGAGAFGVVLLSSAVVTYLAPTLETLANAVVAVVTVAVSVLACLLTGLAALAILGRVRGYSAMSRKVLYKLFAATAAIPLGAGALVLGLGFAVAPALLTVSSVILTVRVLVSFTQVVLGIRASERQASLNHARLRSVLTHAPTFRPALADPPLRQLPVGSEPPRALEGVVVRRPPAV